MDQEGESLIICQVGHNSSYLKVSLRRYFENSDEKNGEQITIQAKGLASTDLESLASEHFL